MIFRDVTSIAAVANLAISTIILATTLHRSLGGPEAQMLPSVKIASPLIGGPAIESDLARSEKRSHKPVVGIGRTVSFTPLAILKGIAQHWRQDVLR